MIEGSEYSADYFGYRCINVDRAGAFLYCADLRGTVDGCDIGSLETFIAIFLSVAIFRLEIRPSVKQLAAAGLASTGVSLVTFY